MPRATPILQEKVIDEAGNIVELAIWRVPVGLRYRGRVRYRLAFIRRGERSPGDHRHVRGVQESYAFVDVDRLIADFVADVRHVTGARTWPER